MSAGIENWREAKCYLFDVEGTLVDAVPATLECWLATARAHELEADAARLHSLLSGMDGDDMLHELFPFLSREERKRLLQAQSEAYREKYLPNVKAFEGVAGVFAKLKERGCRIGLATDCQADELTHYISMTGIGPFLDAVACGGDVEEGKPSPELIALGLERLGASTGVMVGDTPFDALAARCTGILAVGVKTGGFSDCVLRNAGCADVLDDIAAIPAALGNEARGRNT